MFAALLGAGLFYVTRPQRLAGLVETAIERFSSVDAEVESAFLRWNGELTLRGVRLSVPGAPPGAARLLDVEEVMLNPAAGSLFRGRIEAGALVLREPTIHITEDVETGRYNFQMLPQDEAGDFRLPDRLPEVFVSRGVLRFGEIDAGEFQPLEELRLDGTLTQDPDAGGAYGFVLRQQRSGRDPLTLRGVLDLSARRVGAQLEHFKIDDPHRNLLPRGLRDWWDRLQPEGSIPRIDVAFDSDPAVGLHATIELARGGLRLPYGELAPRLSEVDARIVIVRDTISIQKLVGSFEGTRYSIAGTIRGFAEDAAFDLTARTQEFTLTDSPDFVAHLPPRLRKHYDRFSPAGTAWIEASTRRDSRGGEVAYDGVLHVVRGSGRYVKFPYPLVNVRGDIRFNDERVDLELSGDAPGGGTLAIRGKIEPPGDGASVDVTVTATDIAVDEHLTGAMEDDHRKVMDTFLHQPAYDRLRERGVFRAGADDPGDAPVFTLGGRVSATVRIHRPLGHEVKWDVTTTIDTTGAGMLMRHWPYPLRSRGGTIVISQDEVLLRDVAAAGITGGGALVTGRIDGPGRENAPAIRLDRVRMPIDGVLLASLPDTQADWIRQLGLAGTLVGDGRVFNDPDGDIDFDLAVHLADGSLRVLDDALVLRDFSGSLSIRRTSLTLDTFTGQSGETRLGVSGRIGWADDYLDADARISAARLDFTPALLDLIPPDHPSRPGLDAVMRRWNPAGRIDGELDYQTATPTRPEDFTLTLQPQTVAFDLRGERVSFPDVGGTAVLRPRYADVRDVSVPIEGGRATVSGRVEYENETQVAVRIMAEGEGRGPLGRALLPTAVADVVDGLGFEGGYRLTSTLVTRDRPRTGERELEFDGLLTLSGAAADVGVAVTGLDGRLAINAIRRGDARWPTLDIRLDADRARVVDRLVQPLSLHLGSDPRSPDALHLDEMFGHVYGGALVGRGALQLDDPGTFWFDFSLDGVDVDPMIRPTAYPAPAPRADADAGEGPGGGGAFGMLTSASGKLSASLAIEAERGRPETRRGRGALEVRDATLFERPLTMAILQAGNLSLPSHRAFDRAGARYLVVGDTVLFDSVRFESPTIAIAGSGTMDFPTREIDLDLVTRNLTAPDLGLVSDVIHAFKDGLVGIRVTGTLDAPKAGLQSIDGLFSTWHALFNAPAPTPRREMVVE